MSIFVNLTLLDEAEIKIILNLKFPAATYERNTSSGPMRSCDTSDTPELSISHMSDVPVRNSDVSLTVKKPEAAKHIQSIIYYQRLIYSTL